MHPDMPNVPDTQLLRNSTSGDYLIKLNKIMPVECKVVNKVNPGFS